MATKQVRFYGVVKVKANQKFCWISKESKHGWSLGMAIGKNNFFLKNVHFKTKDAVKSALKASIVFVEKVK